MNSYESAVGQLLVRRINEAIAERELTIVNGGCVNTSDLHATASTYIQAVEHIRALRLCLEICKEVERDLRKG